MDYGTYGVISGIKFLGMYSLLVAMIVLGAICNGLVQYSSARKLGISFDKIDIVIAIVISIFSGIIFGLTSAFFWPDDPLILHGVSGMGAFLGLNGLNRITDLFLEMATKHVRERKSDND